MITLTTIDNPQSLEAFVSGPDGANRLFIYTGVAVFKFKGDGDKWRHDTLTFEIGEVFSAGEVLRTVATASLNSISNDNVANDAGWAVDRVTAAWNSEEQRIKVTANLGVRDSDGYLLRMSFQVTVLARVDEA